MGESTTTILIVILCVLLLLLMFIVGGKALKWNITNDVKEIDDAIKVVDDIGSSEAYHNPVVTQRKIFGGIAPSLSKTKKHFNPRNSFKLNLEGVPKRVDRSIRAPRAVADAIKKNNESLLNITNDKRPKNTTPDIMPNVIKIDNVAPTKRRRYSAPIKQIKINKIRFH